MEEHVLGNLNSLSTKIYKFLAQNLNKAAAKSNILLL